MVNEKEGNEPGGSDVCGATKKAKAPSSGGCGAHSKRKCFKEIECEPGPGLESMDQKASKASSFFVGRCKRKRSANCTECVKPTECEPCHGMDLPPKEKPEKDSEKNKKCKPPKQPPPDPFNRKPCQR